MTLKVWHSTQDPAGCATPHKLSSAVQCNARLLEEPASGGSSQCRRCRGCGALMLAFLLVLLSFDALHSGSWTHHPVGCRLLAASDLGSKPGNRERKQRSKLAVMLCDPNLISSHRAAAP